MVVDRHQLEYDGNAVTAVIVTVNNTGSELTADLRVRISQKNGSHLEQKTKMSVVFGQGSTTVTLNFDGQYGHGEFARIDIRLASSL